MKDVPADAEAEPHAVKILNKDVQHEACMPTCFQAGSVSTPSTFRAVETKDEDSARTDTAELPTAPVVDDCVAQDNAITSDPADKVAAAEVSGPSHETTEEG